MDLNDTMPQGSELHLFLALVIKVVDKPAFQIWIEFGIFFASSLEFESELDDTE
jgi:hypothetical protein